MVPCYAVGLNRTAQVRAHERQGPDFAVDLLQGDADFLALLQWERRHLTCHGDSQALARDAASRIHDAWGQFFFQNRFRQQCNFFWLRCPVLAPASVWFFKQLARKLIR